MSEPQPAPVPGAVTPESLALAMAAERERECRRLVSAMTDLAQEWENRAAGLARYSDAWTHGRRDLYRALARELRGLLEPAGESGDG